ncbi:hypothetical protein PROH_05860 [Prochlorothrix hollandica PCC 9006 = CALU 1027]|uniref:Uncharacterized protein n=1 Tax=Prochlorothrix hollandica PCC 9006 = CALU 1027 TaxID=317619 RepID=A0A0M2PWF4_PROHO|nr:hypothetical protein PROH_05860 [Prochlorothrix hollandica PCC 9006 = CALU 1027]
MSSTTSVSDVQDEFAYQLAAEVRQHQQAEPGEGPANGLVAAPAELVAPPQQNGENHPGEAGKDGLVCQVLGKQIIDVQRAGQQRQRQQQPAREEKAEQQAFHGLQWWKVADQPRRVLVLELMVLQQQQDRLEHGDGEHAVGHDREQDMGEDARVFVDWVDGAAGHELCGKDRQCAEREQEQQQVFHRDAQAGQQNQANDRAGDQAGGIEEVQAEAVDVIQLIEQADAVQAKRDHAKQREQTFVRNAALRKAQSLVSGGAGVEEGGGEAGQQRVHKSV